jgi:very-short-patch-repair endonuclease
MPRKKFIQPPPSPIEIKFWEAASSRIPNLQREVWIDKKYRVDFYIPDAKVIIELYGYKYHNEKWKITKDAQRERNLQKKGYQILRFTGSEINKDVHSCVNEVVLIINSLPKEKTHEIPVVRNIPSAIPISIPKVHQISNRKLKVLGMEKWQIVILCGLVLAIIVIVIILAFLVIHSV